MTLIDPRHLYALHIGGGGGFEIDLIDVRTPMEYRAVHVSFARNVPLNRLMRSDVLSPRLEKPGPLYVICQSGTRGRQACEQLAVAGRSDVVNVEGGTAAWMACGLPVTRGRRNVSLERQVRIAAGSLVVLGILLGWLIFPAFFGLAGFVGAGLVFAGITDTCGMGMLISRMPWNRVRDENTSDVNACGTTTSCDGGAGS